MSYAKGDLFELLRAGASTEEQLLDSLVEDERGRDPLQDRAVSAAEKRDKDGWTPLHWAAQDGHERLAAKLLELHVSANVQDNFGATPLMIAAFNNHETVVEVLLNEPLLDIRQVNAYLSTAVHYAAQRGHADVIHKMVMARAEVDALDRQSDTALSWAARNGHFDAVKKLLELRADPLMDNNASEDPIEMARSNKHWDCVEIMEAAVGDTVLLSAST